MTINIEKETERELPFEYEAVIRAVIMETMNYEHCPYEAEINVILTDDNTIHEINNEQRGIDSPTDVLSFPLVDYEEPADFSRLEDCFEDYFNPETEELVLGDIVISVDKVLEQATSYGHSPKRELGFLVAHSMLHLFGYDHMEDAEREDMEKRQREILDKLGIVREKGLDDGKEKK